MVRTEAKKMINQNRSRKAFNEGCFEDYCSPYDSSAEDYMIHRMAR